MNWEDKRQDNTFKRYEDLHAGDVFVWPVDNIIYIKVTDDVAFDICNNMTQDMRGTENVEVRKATLILD